MPATFRKHALVASLALSVWANQSCAGFWEDAAATLPGGLAPSSADLWSSQVDGFKEIMNKGRDGVAFGIWTEHPAFDYDNRSEENALPFGAGVVRTMIDEKGNERMLFGIVFSDSHYYPEPTFGYSWVARWPVSEKYHVGAGYMLGVTFREDYHWLPIPMPLPVVKAGTDDVGLYMTYIPFTNVFFFYGTIATDSLENRLLPTFETSPFSNRFELYGAWMWEKTDSATEEGYMVTSDAGYLLGARYFVADNWAVDFSYTESEHDTTNRGVKDKTFDHTTYSVALQYHVNFNEALRMHAGVGVGYGQWDQQGGDISEDSVFPVVQLGGTWAPTDHTRLLAGINLSFPRYHNVAPEGDVMFRPSPVHMYIGAGIAF